MENASYNMFFLSTDFYVINLLIKLITDKYYHFKSMDKVELILKNN